MTIRGKPKRRKTRRRQALLAHAEELRKARIDTIGDVAGILSHEARNLMGALTTCVRVLSRNPHMAREDAELLDIIQSGSHRLNEIVSELLAFGRPNPPRYEAVEPHELIERTLALLKRDERCAPSIVIHRRLDPSVHHIRADQDQLAAVLWNLLLNAVQAMRDQGQLEVETQKVGKKVKISIRDTGPGIPATALPHIFEPLYSTKPRALGLGLALVRRIVEQHGGEITVTTGPGAGTCFTVLLPSRKKARRSGRLAGDKTG